jgi:hypothetical protein
MTASIHDWRGLLLACLALASLGFANAEAAERTFETPIGTIVLDTASDWKDLRPVPGDLNGVAFQVGAEGRTMQFILATIDEAIDEMFTAEECRELAELMRKEEIKNNVVVSDRVQSLVGKVFAGGYFTARGRTSAVPKSGEYEHMYSGAISTGSAPLVFTIAWNDGGKIAADRALSAVSGLRLRSR